ncbi:hypothetical protein B0T10DRAFT_412199 [Thelonectria olida]|uniref:Uncharacterized protein n=1 Tax=Thelonectria olida TaxID=1576542 RepID=A0A9P9AHM2_9HYPO|nr:hypothetical protein B0T10DRAFT_412199 [Thelonectria olida]
MTPRRAHKKSRTGCANCKRRKVKVYTALSAGTASAAVADASPGSSAAPTPMQPNLFPPTPSSNDGTTAPSPTDFAMVTGLEEIAPFPPHEMVIKDFELMHHYCTVTADSISLRKEMSHVWRVCIPRAGYQHAFVMHGILAIAAAHKAYLMPNNKKMYLTLSAYHQTVGSEGFRSALQNVCPEMGTPLFSFASVIVLLMYTLPSRSVDGKLDDPIHNMLELMGLLRGIKTTLSPFIQSILRSEFAPLIYTVWPLDHIAEMPNTPSLEATVLPLDTWDAMSNLRAFQEAEVPASSLEHYTDTIDHLERATRLVALAGVYVESGAVLVWMYGIHDSILVDIGSHRPHALVILAYYCVLLATLEMSSWCGRGWARQLLDDIEVKLTGHPKFLAMLQWPEKSLVDLYRV